MSRSETHPRGSYPPAPHSRVAGLAGAAGGGEPPRPASRRARSNQLIVCVAVICCAALLCFATGCRDSDALKEIIYDQEVDLIDVDNEDKYWINDPTADEESDEVSSTEVVSDKSEAEIEQNLVVFSSKPNSPEYAAKQSLWSEDPDFEGIEASNTVAFYLSEEDVKATIPQESDDEDDEPEDSDIVVAGSSGQNGSLGSGGTGESEEEGEQTSTDADNYETEAGEGAGAGGDAEADIEVVTVDATDDFTDPPAVDHVAAFGQFAVIVQMIGGEGALVAADSEILSDSGFKTVFADEGVSDIVVGWKDGGTAEGLDVDAIIESGAETILCTSSDYQSGVSNSDRKKLNAAGVTFTVVADLTCSTLIKNTVTTVGKMFRESTVIGNAGDTVSLAKEYKTFHDSLVKACTSANGGLALGTTDEKPYENNNSSNYSYDSAAHWTLLIDEWDSTVRWNGSSYSDLAMNGAGISVIGYKTRATSFYIQAGGLVNSAAAKLSSKSGSLIAWQFGSSIMPYKNNFSYGSGGAFDESSTPSSKNSEAWSNQIANLWGLDLFAMSKSAASSGNAGGGGVAGYPPASFGCDSFPCVIAATQEIKEKMIENSAKSFGAYTPYPVYSNNIFGCYYGLEDDDTLWGSIGADGEAMSENAFADNDYVISDESVCVAPHGLFTSWTEGTSVESVLLSAWVSDVVNGEGDEVGWKSYVKEFYSTFYRYSLSDSELATIEEGLEK